MPYIGKVPEIFRIADRMVKLENAELEAKGPPRPPRPPRIVPMPRIESNPNVRGPIQITQKLFDDFYEEQEMAREMTEREYQRAILELLARKLHFETRLKRLDFMNLRDSRRAASINMQLRDIEMKLKKLQKESGINIDRLEIGSRFSRFVQSFKKKLKKIWKKTKAFWRRNGEGIITMAIIVASSIFTGISQSRNRAEVHKNIYGQE